MKWHFKVVVSCGRGDIEVQMSRTKSTFFFRIERCMVQKHDFFGSETKLGSLGAKKRDTF